MTRARRWKQADLAPWPRRAPAWPVRMPADFVMPESEAPPALVPARIKVAVVAICVSASALLVWVLS